MSEQRIEFPMIGGTYTRQEYGVYEYGEYDEHSVLAGYERRSFLDSFLTLAEAQAAYPKAEFVSGSGYHPVELPSTPPAWFDPSAAGESWDEED